MDVDLNNFTITPQRELDPWNFANLLTDGL